jgi:chorismate mutase
MPTDTESPDELKRLRAQIDHLDAELMQLLSERHGLMAQVAEAKATHDSPALDEFRELEITARAREWYGDEVASMMESIVTRCRNEVARRLRRKREEERAK